MLFDPRATKYMIYGTLLIWAMAFFIIGFRTAHDTLSKEGNPTDQQLLGKREIVGQRDDDEDEDEDEDAADNDLDDDDDPDDDDDDDDETDDRNKSLKKSERRTKARKHNQKP